MDSRLVFLVAFVIASAVPSIKADWNATALNYNITRNECRKTKLCVENPTGCDPSGTSDCSFTSTQFNPTSVSLSFELSGNSTGYIALAAGGSTNMAQGRNVVFVCGNNNGTFFFKTANLTANNTLQETTSPTVTDIQYNLNQSSIIQCAFKIAINLTTNNDALSILGINSTTFNISNIANATLIASFEVFQGSVNGTVLIGTAKSTFGGPITVNLANVNSSIATTTVAPSTTKKTTSGSASPFGLMSNALLLAAIALRLL
nr:putative ferric-chelate reductase 1 [Misgurnus anguillicaudatus]